MVVVTDIDSTWRDPRTQSLAPADLALATRATGDACLTRGAVPAGWADAIPGSTLQECP
jgi:hypothetical protein